MKSSGDHCFEAGFETNVFLPSSAMDCLRLVKNFPMPSRKMFCRDF